MKRLGFLTLTAVFSIGAAAGLKNLSSASARAQFETPTPTSVSPTGIYITVSTDEPFANVRMGPSSTMFAKVGILYPGESAPALGRSPGGDWIQIVFPGAPDNKGWIYSPLVRVTGGTLQIVEPPPTPVPPPTSTIDPTLAAQFTILPTSTRLATFTPAPTFAPVTAEATEAPVEQTQSVPLAIIIMTLGGFGIATFLTSLFIKRR